MAAVAIFGLTALSFYVVNGPGRSVPAEQHRNSGSTEPVEDPDQINVLIPTMSDTGDLDYIALGPADSLVQAINVSIHELKSVQHEAKLEEVRVKDGLATLYFTKELDSGYGSEGERILIDSIRRHAGQDSTINEIQILVGGEKIESLGHFSIEKPIPVIRTL